MSRARFGLLTLVLLALVLLPGCGRSSAKTRINGGGATFIEPLINTWQPVYAKEFGVQIDYTGTGSGNGIQQMIAQSILFGCTDAPMNAEQLAAAQARDGAVLHIPLALGGVVPIYNLPDLPADSAVRFTGAVLADIFLGDITRWNDPALCDLNPGVRLPDLPIKVVSRSDPSGTTAIFAEYLAKSRPEAWEARKMGRGTSVTFATGVRQPKNPGVAGEVSRYPGAIGYVELTFAKLMKDKVGIGSVKNRAGRFVSASPESITAAAASLETLPEDLCFSLVDTPGAEAYPISGADWAVFYRKLPADAGPILQAFLQWATRPEGGQKYAADLGYAPLPAAWAERIRARLDTIALH